MKRLFTVTAALIVAVSANAKIGIVAGVTSSSSSIETAANQLQTGDIARYHVGVAYNIALGPLAIQPALIYNVKGAKLNEYANGTATANSEIFQTGFLELPVQIQAGIKLLGFRPYVFAEPFVGYAITNETIKSIKGSQSNTSDWANVNRLEYGVGGGLGVDIFNHIQISVRYYWNLGQLYKDGEVNIDGNSIVDTVKNQQCSGIMASVAFFF